MKVAHGNHVSLKWRMEKKSNNNSIKWKMWSVHRGEQNRKGKERKEEKKKQFMEMKEGKKRKKRKIKERNRRRIGGGPTILSPFFGVRQTKEYTLFTLQEVRVSPTLVISCLRVIQWPLCLALTIGLVHDNLDQIVGSLEPFSVRFRLNKLDFFFLFFRFRLAGCWPEEVVESEAN